MYINGLKNPIQVSFPWLPFKLSTLSLCFAGVWTQCPIFYLVCFLAVVKKILSASVSCTLWESICFQNFI